MQRDETWAMVDSCLAELKRATPEQSTIWRENLREQFGCDLQTYLTGVYKDLLIETGFEELRAELAETFVNDCVVPRKGAPTSQKRPL